MKPPRLARRPRLERLEDRISPAADATGVPRLTVDNSEFVPDHLLVRFQDGVQVETGDRVELVSGGLYLLHLSPGESVADARASFGGRADVQYAEPDYIVHADQTPNDPRFGELWGMNNTGQSGGTPGADIGAPAAWDVTVGSGNTVVAMIDTGIDYTHPDLAANVWTNPGEIPGNRVDDDHNGFVDDVHGYDFVNNDGDPRDDNGHGTHTAGTVGAVGNNGIGVAGVNWHVQLMALKFLDAKGNGSTSNAVRAVNYSVQMGAKISSNSWGGGGFSQSLYNAISAAAAAGQVFVAAAGNDGLNTDNSASYPADYNLANIISVAAIDRNNNLASFSNYGAKSVDIGAPGVSILSTLPNNSYGINSGTSMATPHVAGAVALLRDANPNWTTAQLIDRALSTATPTTSLTGKTASGGRLNVAAMLAGSQGQAPPPDVTGAHVVDFSFGGPAGDQFNRVRVNFSEPIMLTSFTIADAYLNDPDGSMIYSTDVVPISDTNRQSFDVIFPTQTRRGTFTLFLGPDIQDDSGNMMDQNQDGINGDSLLDQLHADIKVGPPLTVASASVPKKIVDGRTSISTLTVDQDFTIGDLNATLNIGFPSDRYLNITLVAPWGQKVTLFDLQGGTGANLTGTIFDDEAGTAIGDGAAPFVGSFRPEQPLTAFDGRSARGTWQLIVAGLGKEELGGSLTGWSLTFANY